MDKHNLADYNAELHKLDLIPAYEAEPIVKRLQRGAGYTVRGFLPQPTKREIWAEMRGYFHVNRDVWSHITDEALDYMLQRCQFKGKEFPTEVPIHPHRNVGIPYIQPRTTRYRKRVRGAGWTYEKPEALPVYSGTMYQSPMAWVPGPIRVLTCEEFLSLNTKDGSHSVRWAWATAAYFHGFHGPVGQPGQARSLRLAFQRLGWEVLHGPAIRIHVDKQYTWRSHAKLGADCWLFRSPFKGVTAQDFLAVARAWRQGNKNMLSALLSMAQNESAIVDEAAMQYAVEALAGLGGDDGPSA